MKEWKKAADDFQAVKDCDIHSIKVRVRSRTRSCLRWKMSVAMK